MKLHPRVTKTAVELVKRFEGLRRRAARLPDGSWTIGYGHTKTARQGAEVTPDEAELLLYYDLTEVATKVEAWTFTPLNQNQFEALVAFAFNIGTDNFRGSTVLKRVNEGQPLPAAAAMELWRKTEVNGEGIVIDALVRRRAAEKAHFLTPPEGFRPSPSQVLRPAFDFQVLEAATLGRGAHTSSSAHATSHHTEPRPDGAEEPALTSGLFEPASPEPAGPGPESEEPWRESLGETADASTTTISDDASKNPFPDAPIANEDSASIDSPINNITDPSDPFLTVISTPVARSFEPPPSRFDRAPESITSIGDATSAHPPLSGASSELSGGLFGRPLPPSAFQAEPATDDKTDLSMAPGGQSPRRKSGGSRGKGFGSRTVMWAFVGAFGLLFFVLAILSMLLGRASLAHLVVGFIGVVMLTPAGVYFLLHRPNTPPSTPSAPEAKPS